MPLVYRHRVRYHEADAQGYLFNGRYLEIADVAMTEFFRSIGYAYGDLVAAGVDPSVVHASIEFLRPVRFDDDLEAWTDCARVGRSSFDLDTAIRRGDGDVARIHIVYVNVDPSRDRSREIPGEVARALRAAMPASPRA